MIAETNEQTIDEFQRKINSQHNAPPYVSKSQVRLVLIDKGIIKARSRYISATGSHKDQALAVMGRTYPTGNYGF